MHNKMYTSSYLSSNYHVHSRYKYNTCLTHSNIHSDVTDRIPHLQEASYLGPFVNLHNKWVTFLVNLSANLAPRTLHKFQSRILSFSSYCETQNRRFSKPGKGTRQGSGE